MLRKENCELVSENENVKNNLMGIEDSYYCAMNELKSKVSLNDKEKEKIEEFNEQLVHKLRTLQQKF